MLLPISSSILLYRGSGISTESPEIHSTEEETMRWESKSRLFFPEIEYDKIDKVRGMDIIFVTTAKTDEEAKALLKMMGMPFDS